MTTKTPETTYRLVRPDVVTEVPELDDDQQRVVDHQGGPLLVLAGPGTGKTTTLVEAIVDRVEQRGARPDQILALTFSRKAAEQLRDRVTGPAGSHDVDQPELDLPLVRLRARPPLLAARALLLTAASAVGPGAGRDPARAAQRPPRVGDLARRAGARADDPRLRP